MSDPTKVNKKATVNLEELFKKDAPYLVEDGKVNIDKLKTLLTGKTTEKEDDRFYFNWAGKDKVFQAIQAPAYSTLIPQKDRSIGWDDTDNLMIVGENLETLKLLLKPYFGKVKVIYIDPPYNTGKDFIYKDDFSAPLKDYLVKTGQKDSNGVGLTTNTETNGRFHSAWLNFMYPRLFMARNLLRDDGVILVSIDDNEVHHLRMIMDDIFGEDNFSCEFIWEKKKKPSFLHKNVGKLTEYVLCYVKDNFKTFPFSVETTTEGKKYPINNAGNSLSTLVFPPHSVSFNMKDQEIEAQDMSEGNIKTKLLEKVTIKNGMNANELILEGEWRYNQETLNEIVRDGDEIRVSKIPFRPNHIKKGGEIKKMKNILSPHHYGMETNEDATQQLIDLFGQDIFDNPKPAKLLETLVQGVTYNDEKCIVLDFFAGSGTLGQAIYAANQSDQLKRQFIMVQIDETVDETKETGKNAKALGLNTVADICVDRLKRVSEKNDNKLKYKVFKLAPSNFNLKEEFELTENKDLDELKADYLKELGLYVNQPTVATAQPLDIIYEIILKNGFSLNAKIDEIKLGSCNFYHATDAENNLEIYICLDSKVDDASVETVRTKEYKGKTFVFYDNALTDSQKINLNTFVKLQVI